MKPPTACYFIENKAFFFPPPLEEGDEPQPLSTPCWCLRTHEATGPDGDAVDVDICVKGRSCYKPEVDLDSISA